MTAYNNTLTGKRTKETDKGTVRESLKKWTAETRVYEPRPLRNAAFPLLTNKNRFFLLSSPTKNQKLKVP